MPRVSAMEIKGQAMVALRSPKTGPVYLMSPRQGAQWYSTRKNGFLFRCSILGEITSVDPINRVPGERASLKAAGYRLVADA